MGQLRIAAFLVILAFLGSCAKRDSAKNSCTLNTELRPVVLLSGELSYSPYEKYADLLSDSSIHWIEREGDFGQDGPSVNRFEVTRTFLEYPGKLEYVFYFRRLAEMRFHPDNPSLFFQAARRERLPASVGEERVVGDLRYWANGEQGAPQYLGLSDTRIIRSFLACIADLD